MDEVPVATDDEETLRGSQEPQDREQRVSCLYLPNDRETDAMAGRQRR